jgi:hypothetical protein
MGKFRALLDQQVGWHGLLALQRGKQVAPLEQTEQGGLAFLGLASTSEPRPKAVESLLAC